MVVSTRPVLQNFQPKFEVNLDLGEYVVRTAQNALEVDLALQLRYRVFCQELGATTNSSTHDVDEYDQMADHLLLIEKSTASIIGTYRFLCSKFTDRFYSQGEFDLSNLLAQPGEKLELGRACVLASHRGSMAIQLLWKGMTTYFQICGARYMFGCSSVDVQLKEYFPALNSWFMSNHLCPSEMRITPVAQLPNWIDINQDVDSSILRKAERLVPPLLKAYLRAGAKVGGAPFWDLDFQTLDYFTIFDAHKITDSYGRKYGI
jgi:putative hemolysin